MLRLCGPAGAQGIGSALCLVDAVATQTTFVLLRILPLTSDKYHGVRDAGIY